MDFDARLYAKVGGLYRRKVMPPPTSLNFELLERGGMGAGDFSLPLTWEDYTFDGTEFLDVRLLGSDTIWYRGFVQIPAHQIEATEQVSVTMQGPIAVLNKWPVRWKLAYGINGTDLSNIAQDLLTDFVALTDRWTAYLAQDLQTVGVTLKEFDATGRSVAQALNMLVDNAPNLAIWGVEASWDAGPPGNPIHRVYVRPKPSTTAKYYSIGKHITGFAYPLDTSGIINVVSLTGGPVEQPNLCPNPSFEDVAPAGETVGNLLLDYSFEDNDAAWSLTGTRKYTGLDATARGTPKDGKYWLELDTNTEKGEQVVLASYTEQYDAWCWIRREDTAATQVKLTIEGLDAGNSVIVSSATAYTTPSGTNWEKLQVTRLDPTAQPTVVKIRYRVETNGGSASNDGVLVDSCALVVADSAGAVGWRRIVAGNANASTFQWNYRPATLAFHGGYVVRSDPSSIGAGTDYVEIRTTKDKRIEVNPNDRYSFLVWLYIVDPADVAIGIIEYDGSGTTVATNVGATTTMSVVGWNTIQFIVTAGTDGPGLTTNANTRSVELFIRHLDNDQIYIDACFFCLGDFPADLDTGVPSGGDYWTGDNYEKRFTVEDSFFAPAQPYALDADAYASISTYGEREEEVTETLVTDLTGAKQWAKDYFNVAAVPSVQANLRIQGMAESGELLNCADGKVKVSNLLNGPDPLFPARVHYQIAGDTIDMSADLGNERPQFEGLLRYIQGREKGRSF